MLIDDFIGEKILLIAEKERLNDLARADVDEIRELSSTVARCAIAMDAVVASHGK